MNKYFILIFIVINILSLVLGFTTNFSTTIILVFCVSLYISIYLAAYRNKKIISILIKSTVIILLFFISFNIFIYNFGKNDNAQYNEDALIILGAGINGETLSLRLKARLDAAYSCYLSNPDAFIVVSGGQGPGENITEALAMERYLISKNVPKEKIIREEKSTSTYENLTFSKIILDNYLNKDYRVTIITNDFHIFRSNMIAKRIGLNSTHIHAKIPIYSIPSNYLRETIAIIFQLVQFF